MLGNFEAKIKMPKICLFRRFFIFYLYVHLAISPLQRDKTQNCHKSRLFCRAGACYTFCMDLNKDILHTFVKSRFLWRYATKKFDKTKKLTPQQLDVLLEALRLSPSSMGLEPWKFIVVASEEMKNKLIEGTLGQSQVADASHVIVLCALKNLDATHVEKHIAQAAKLKCEPVANLDKYKISRMNYALTKTPEEKLAWAIKQVYIALGCMLTAAAMIGVDACPMEGFDKAKYSELLQLDEKNLVPVVVCPVGFRDETDKYAHMCKVRFDKEEVIELV